MEEENIGTPTDVSSERDRVVARLVGAGTRQHEYTYTAVFAVCTELALRRPCDIMIHDGVFILHCRASLLLL